jgi:hypothetical protein
MPPPKKPAPPPAPGSSDELVADLGARREPLVRSLTPTGRARMSEPAAIERKLV